MPEEREDIEATLQQDTAPDTSQQKRKWRSIDWIAGGTFIAEVLWGSWWLVTQVFHWCSWNPRVSTEHFAQFYCGVGLGILSVGYLVLILWPIIFNIFKQGRDSKQDNDPRWFHARILSSGIVGGSYAFLLPAVMSLPEGGINSGGAAALRQAILLATGGLIALIALGETRRKNDNDKLKNDQDKEKNDREHERWVKAERRERYAKAVEQLGDEKAPVRMGGVYTLVGLVDDWLEEKSLSDDEKLKEGQAIINNLCAYIRSPFTLVSYYDELSQASPTPEGIYKDKEEEFYADKAVLESEADVRFGIIKEIHDHIQASRENNWGPWSNFEYNFSGSVFFYPVELTKSYYKKPVNFSGSHYYKKVDFSGSTYEKDATFSNSNFRSTYKGEADFSDSIYGGWADFRGSIYYDEAGFSASTYTGNANFNRSTYTGSADFGGSTYTGSADFGGSTYTGNANFGDSTYTGNARFGNSTYTGSASFSSSTYTGSADFSSSTYTGSADFSSSTYKSWASFHGSTYKSWASFGSSTYQNEVKFGGSTYTGNANFGDSTYKSWARFGNSTYTGSARFGNSTYTGSASFSSSTYMGSANFCASNYQSKAYFSSSTYTGSADFFASNYQSKADFSSSTYQGEADFSSSTYQGEARFGNSTYMGSADFGDSTYTGSADFCASNYQSKAGFSSSTYMGSADFSDSTYTGSADFSDSNYQSKADFGESTLQGETDFSGSIFYSDIYFGQDGGNSSFSRFTDCAPRFYDEINHKNTLFGSHNNDFTVDAKEGYSININSEGLPLDCKFLTSDQKEQLADNFQEIEKIQNELLEAKDSKEKVKISIELRTFNENLHEWRKKATTVKVEDVAAEDTES